MPFPELFFIVRWFERRVFVRLGRFVKLNWNIFEAQMLGCAQYLGSKLSCFIYI